MTVLTLRKLLRNLNPTSFVYVVHSTDVVNAGKKLDRVMTMKDGKSTWVKLVTE
jgi:hypothetical protein